MSAGGFPERPTPVTLGDPLAGPPSLGLPRGVLVLLGAAAATVTVAGIHEFASIIGPVVLALMLTVAVSPGMNWARARGAPGWAAMLGGLVAVYSIVLGVVVALGISVARLAEILPSYQDEFSAVLTDVADAAARVGVGAEQVDAASAGLDLTRVTDFVQSILSSAGGLLSQLLLLVTLLLFMGMDAGRFVERLSEVPGRRGLVVEAFRTFAQGTRRYLVVSSIFGLIVAVIDTFALWLLGVPLPVLWGLLSFITNFIPNIGFVLGLIPPALLGLLEGGPTLMLAVILTYSVVNVIIQSVIQPKVIGDSVGLSTTATFLSLIVWAWVLGPLGALLAVPLSLLTKGLLVDIDPDTRWLSPLLSGVRDSDKPLPSLERPVTGDGSPP